MKFYALVPVLILAIVLLGGCTQNNGGYNIPPAGQQATGSDTGRVVFAITDPSADTQSVSSVDVTVNKVSAHSQSDGWVVVSSEQNTYDLLQLDAEGKKALLAESEMKAGTYDQVRLEISKVEVTDGTGTHEAKLPSGEIKIVGNMVVDANSTTAATFDFVADESLHVTGNGKYVFAPVIRLETRSDAEVSLSSNGAVEINGGTVDTKVTVGMDEEGNVGVNLGIPANAEIIVDDITGAIRVGAAASGKAGGRMLVTITDAAADMGTVTSVKVTVESASVHSSASGWVEVSSSPMTYDLLELRESGRAALVADSDLNSGTYGQIKLEISKAEVTDESGTHEAKLPSGELKIMGAFDVNADSTTAATFDFNVSKSIHVTGNGQYIFAPVISLKVTEGASVDASSAEDVKIQGGRVKSDVTVGMDANGKVGVGIEIPAGADVAIEGSKVKIKVQAGGSGY